MNSSSSSSLLQRFVFDSSDRIEEKLLEEKLSALSLNNTDTSEKQAWSVSSLDNQSQSDSPVRRQPRGVPTMKMLLNSCGVGSLTHYKGIAFDADFDSIGDRLQSFDTVEKTHYWRLRASFWRIRAARSRAKARFWRNQKELCQLESGLTQLSLSTSSCGGVSKSNAAAKKRASRLTHCRSECEQQTKNNTQTTHTVQNNAQTTHTVQNKLLLRKKQSEAKRLWVD